MASYFISDLHLSEARPDITAALLRFLDDTIGSGDRLYVLGDLFDVWVGDDVSDRCSEQVAAAFAATAKRGAELFYIHGNRDFLLGQRFAQRAAMTILPELTVIDLYGQTALLMHGDSLCTQDLAYMAFRRKSRSWWWQALVLHTPRWYRLRRAKAYRDHSKMVKQLKSAEIMDVTPSEVVRVMTESATRLLIHGHTHRPACHQLKVAGATSWRIVLGEWHHSLSYLKVTATSRELIFAPLASSGH